MSPEELPEQSEQGPAPELATLPAIELEELKARAADRDRFLAQAQRAAADYENLHKRVQRERESMRQQLLRELVSDILPLADDLERAAVAGREYKDLDRLVEGAFLVFEGLLRILEKKGVRAIEVAGKPFDPAWHEAIMVEPSAELPPNTVLAELRRGWALNDVVIRPAQVKVSSQPPSQG